MQHQIPETLRLPIIRCDSSTSPELANHNNNHPNHHHNLNESKKLNLPQPSFRKAQNYEYRKRTHTAIKDVRSKKKRPDSYYIYEEPDPEELNNTVEYDMDLLDMAWLEDFNKKVGKPNNFQITEQDFEKIMDRLEKESYFESQNGAQSVIPTVDEDAVCAICNDGECNNANVILFCDMCDLAVHQECYGVPYVPEGQWLCRRCLQSPLRNVNCVFCPNVDGAFKQTDDNRWSHVICALWIPEVNFANTVFLEPIENIHKIPTSRWRLNCYICKQKKVGACIQCESKDCYQSFHVTCAQQAKLYMKISQCEYDSPSGGKFTDVKKEAYCDKHTPKDASAGGGMYSGDETDEDVNTEDYRRKDDKRKKQLKQTRKLLAERRHEMREKKTALIKVDRAKLKEIEKCFSIRGRKECVKSLEKLRSDYVDRIHTYWQLKREARNGVPLLRRLQVTSYKDTDPLPDDKLDKQKYTMLRYDLEKCRLLLGAVKKREQLKKSLFLTQSQILNLRMDRIDKEDPPEED